MILTAIGGGIIALFPTFSGYWRVPVRFWKRFRSPKVEPAVNQVWTECLFTKKDFQWRITEIKNGFIYIKKLNPGKHDVDLTDYIHVEDWSTCYLQHRRIFCSKLNDSVHHNFWGQAED